MTKLEQVIETTRSLPPADRQHLRQWLDEQERLDALAPVPEAQSQQASHPTPSDAAVSAREAKLRQELDEYRRAKQWIAEHRAEYLGQWVALEGERLVSHGVDALQVHNEAKAAGITSPFLERMIEEEGPYWGGWL